MKYLRTLLIGIFVLGFLSPADGTVPLAGSPQDFSDRVSLPCTTMFQEQEIPDDGTWLSICLVDPWAPEGSTVTAVHIKYLLDHPAPEEVEIRLRHADVNLTFWDGRPLVGEAGEARDITVFNGTPSSGEWYIEARDRVPGMRGRLRGFTLRAEYALPFPLPQPLSGSAGRPGVLRLPVGIVPPTAPDRDEEKSGTEGDWEPPQPNGWQVIKWEDFEGQFPNSGWVVMDTYPGDGKEYYWDDDDYRAHGDGRDHRAYPDSDPWPWAAWPANGGANGYDPALDPHYRPYMAAWMIYGPFDLSDARAWEVDFWLWREIEPLWDRVWFAFSPDGQQFYGWWWDGTADWEEKNFVLGSYLGDASVWAGWFFESDGSIEFEGPWMDDILICKYAPGQVTVQGALAYADRGGNSAPGRYTPVYLYDHDPGEADDLLARTITVPDGSFYFPALTNWDEDGTEPDPDHRRLDIYLVFVADHRDIADTHHRVVDLNDRTYAWVTPVQNDVEDGTFSAGWWIPHDYAVAMWIFQDLRRAWQYVYAATGRDAGSVTAKWQDGEDCCGLICGSHFWGGPGGPFIFIADSNAGSGDAVVHEAGHHYMYNATGWWLWYNIGCYSHNLFSQEDADCAWSEGWADFLPLAVNGDPCYDFGRGPCGAGGGAFEDLEARNRNDLPPLFPWGDTVEGRVAGALYDLFDNTNEGFDSANFGFRPIVDLVFQEPLEQTFRLFWQNWMGSGQNRHHAVRAIYQNTIDYDTPPRFEPPLPDCTVLQGLGWENAVDLWAYSTDEESNDWELDWQIVYVSDGRCGVTIDAWDHVDIHPEAGWSGSCEVTIRVSDSLQTADDTFRVNVVPVRARVFLPLALKCP